VEVGRIGEGEAELDWQEQAKEINR
jgi:hypothetical protein